MIEKRQYDLEILQSIRSVSTVPQSLEVSAVSGTSRAVTGIQKLVQRYVLALVTSAGSVRFDEKFGTQFWEAMVAGATQNAGRLKAAFAFANLDAVRSVRDEESKPAYGPMPDDEKLKTARLNEFDIDMQRGTLYLGILIESQAGGSYSYRMPVNVLGG